MKKLLLALTLLTGGLFAQNVTYHGYYNYYGSAYYYGQPSFTQIQHLYFPQYSSWFGSGAYCNAYPTPGDNIDFAFQMPCGCLGGCLAVMYAANQSSNQNMHEEGTNYDPVFMDYQQDFAWDYGCSMYYTGPVTEYSDFFGCP